MGSSEVSENERVELVGNKYVIEVLKKELESLEEEKWGIELLKEDGTKFSTEWLNKELKEVNAKIDEIELHIEFM